MFSVLKIHKKIPYPKIRYLNKGLDTVIRYRLNRAITWYNNHPSYVSDNNIIHRIMRSFKFPRGMTDITVENHVHDKAFNHAESLGLWTARQYGKIFVGNFYGSNVTDIITLVDNDYSIKKVEKNWVRYCPIKVLRHDFTHFSYTLMGHRYKSERPGFCIIEVDINLLYLMYHCCLKKKGEIDIGHFLGQYVFPNMLFSHFDQVIINKYTGINYPDLKPTRDLTVNALGINGESDQLNRDIETDYQNLVKSNASIEMISTNIKGITGENALCFMDVQVYPLTKYNKWIYMLSFSRYLNFCLRTPKYGYRTLNSFYLRQYKRYFGFDRSTLAFESGVIRQLFYDVYLKEIKPILETE